MIKSLKAWLKKPYYVNPSLIYKTTISLAIGVFVFIFLYIFRPFILSKIDNNSVLVYTLAYGLIASISVAFVLLILPYFFKNLFCEEKRTILKEIIIIAICVIIITLLNWNYTKYMVIVDFVKPSYLTIISYTFSISSIPIILFLFIYEKFTRQEREKVSKEIMETKPVKAVINYNQEIDIYSKNKKSKISFELDKLIYITTEGNYCSFFIKKPNKIKELIVRNTLNNVSDSLSEYEKFIRCHRSYIINTKYVDSISGNGRGYYLNNEELGLEIPVSRTFKKEDIVKML